MLKTKIEWHYAKTKTKKGFSFEGEAPTTVGDEVE